MPKLWLENSSPEFETAAREYFELGQKDADVGVIFLVKSLAIDIKNRMQESYEVNIEKIEMMLANDVKRILTVGDTSTINGKRWLQQSDTWSPLLGASLNCVEGMSHLIIEVIAKSRSSKTAFYSVKTDDAITPQKLSKIVSSILSNDSNYQIHHQGITHIMV